MSGISFRRPFFEGGSINVDVPDHLQVSIAGHGYIIDPKLYKRMFVSQMRPSQDGSTEPGEQSINPEAVWRRSRSDWGFGAGQTYLDSAASVPNRFHASKGIDPWTPHQVTLLPATGQERTLQQAGKVVCGLVDDGLYLFDVDADSVLYADTPTSSYAACTGLGTHCYDIAHDGAYVYVVSGTAGTTKIYQAAAGTTAFTALTGTADAYVGVGYANGRLFAWTSDGEMFEIGATGTPTLVLRHRLGTAFDWVGVVATTNSTLLLGNAGANAEVYRVADTDATGALDPPIIAINLIDEQVRCGAYENGIVIIGVERSDGGGNVRIGTTTASGAITMGPAVIVDNTPGPVEALCAAGRFVWFGWSDYDDDSTGCGRLDLTVFMPGASSFSPSLLPAYATDQMATAQGAVTSIIRFDDQLVFTVEGDGVWVEGNVADGTPMTGTFTTGRIRMGLLDFKSFISVDARWDALGADATIECGAVVDDGPSRQAIYSEEDGTTGPASGPQSIGATVGEWCELTFTLTGESDGTWPVLRWWVLRGVPTTGANQRIQVPIIMANVVKAGAEEQRGDVNFDVVAEMEFLESLVASRQVFTYQEGVRTELVYMANLQMDGLHWSWQQRHIEGVVTAELRTLE